MAGIKQGIKEPWVQFPFFLILDFTLKPEKLIYINFHVFSSGRQFFSSRLSFFTSSYNFEVNLHEKVGQKIEKACWAKYREGKLVRKKIQKNWNFFYEEARKEKSSLFGIFFTSSSVKKIPVFLEFFLRANFSQLHIWNAGFSHKNRSVLKNHPGIWREGRLPRIL